MTTASRDQVIHELRSRIKLLEKQQGSVRQHMQEKLLLLLLAESVHQADSVDELLVHVLERFTVVLDVPMGAYFEFSDLRAVPVEVCDLGGERKINQYAFSIDRQLAGKLKKGPVLLSSEEDGFTAISTDKAFLAEHQTIALFPFQSLYVPFGLFAFFGSKANRDQFESISPVIQHLIKIIAEKFEKLKLMQELKDLNQSFDLELAKRMEGLQESYNKLHLQVQDLQKKLKRTEREDKAQVKSDPALLHSFLKSIGVEIRTPLNGIMGFAELIRDNDLLPDDKNKFIDIIKSCGKSLVKIVDDATEFSLVKSGRLSVNNTEFPLAPFMTELYDHYKKDELFRQREQLDLKINLNINGLSLINTDRDKLTLVLTNLIGNSIKFTDKGVIEFGCNIQERKPKRSKKKKCDVIFFVRDTGIGIAEEHADKVFQEFYKVEHEISKLYGGLGLGLTISKALVEMMGGKIWFETEKGKGSCFYFTVPEAMVLSEAELEVLAENGFDHPLDWSDKKILIVEDDAMSVIYLKEALKSTDAQLMHASDGKAAVELVSSGMPIDIILMDIKLPGMSGYEATKKIKAITEIPIIAQTAYAMADDYKKMLQAGCDDYVSKPINRKKLLKKISDIFTREK